MACSLQKVSGYQHHNPSNPVCYFDIYIDDLEIGRIEFELFEDIVPKTVNFIVLCCVKTGFGYKNSIFTKIIQNYIIQGGNIKATSIYGAVFDDENFNILHDGAGILSMTNNAPNTNSLHFTITCNEAQYLNNKFVAFGRICTGMDYLKVLEKQGSVDQSGQTTKKCIIKDCGVFICADNLGNAQHKDLLNEVHVTAIKNEGATCISKAQTNQEKTICVSDKSINNNIRMNGMNNNMSRSMNTMNGKNMNMMNVGMNTMNGMNMGNALYVPPANKQKVNSEKEEEKHRNFDDYKKQDAITKQKEINFSNTLYNFNSHQNVTRKKSRDTVIGTYQSNGTANGRELYEGPRGGTFYVNSNNNKTYVNKNNKNVVGVYQSHGCANGRALYKGPKGGTYTITSSGRKSYTKKIKK